MSDIIDNVNDPQALGLVPMVIETTGRGERAFDIYSRLLKERVIGREDTFSIIASRDGQTMSHGHC